jgi:uncharacterized protein (TIGR03437 family)
MLVAIRGARAGVTSVLFAGSPAAILAMDDAHILVQAPATIAGMRQVEIEAGASTVATVVDAAPALFTHDATGSGQAAAVNADGTLNSAEHPAGRGSWISLYATGEGIGGLPVTARIGGYQAEVLYAGAVAGYPGLFQINARVPGGYVPPGKLSVVVTVGSVDSPAGVTIAVQ